MVVETLAGLPVPEGRGRCSRADRRAMGESLQRLRRRPRHRAYEGEAGLRRELAETEGAKPARLVGVSADKTGVLGLRAAAETLGGGDRLRASGPA